MLMFCFYQSHCMQKKEKKKSKLTTLKIYPMTREAGFINIGVCNLFLRLYTNHHNRVNLIKCLFKCFILTEQQMHKKTQKVCSPNFRSPKSVPNRGFRTEKQKRMTAKTWNEV